MTDMIRRITRFLWFRWLTCTACGASQRLQTKWFGRTIVLDERVRGWTFTTAAGWRCPRCGRV